jgi:hypothetical protein
VPAISAASKGPNQINLTWSAVANPGYGFLVEIQSSGDSRYASWQELSPMPGAGGYSCDSTVIINGGTCNISDPTGIHVYNPPNNGIAPWVTDATYIDPQDGSPTQFIAAGLAPNTTYNFRVRTYSGVGSPIYSAYSNVATVATANYDLRYVSTTGDNNNDGTAPDDAHAWRNIIYGSMAITCGQALIVMGGTYSGDDYINLSQTCTATNKAVVMANPGDAVVLWSPQHGIDLEGNYVVVDGITSATSPTPTTDYDVTIAGNYDALFNVESYPIVIPSIKNMTTVYGDHNLIYHCYFHDAYSPDATQNVDGDGGWVLAFQGGTNSVVWSNHLTRGGHDTSLCISGCSNNRWLNNVMDGGWGMAFEAITGGQNNLIEGNFIKDVGQLVSFYKPSIEISDANNTVRRNISVNGKYAAVEVSALYSGNIASNVLVYNNVFYKPLSCFFQSANGGAPPYDDDIFSNNICYLYPTNGTTVYQGNTTNQISHNTFVPADSSGAPQFGTADIIWDVVAGGSSQYPQTLSYADTNYVPVFSNNQALEVLPQFVDEANFDFHLSATSPLIGAGTSIADPGWGSVSLPSDLGAFGAAIGTATTPPPAMSVSPASGSGSTPQLTFTFSGISGAASFNMLINSSLTGSGSCYVIYEPGANTIDIADDSGSVVAMRLTPGGSGTLANSQCSVPASGVAVNTAGSTTTISFAVTFASSFAGAKTIWASWYSGGIPAVPWQPVGSWTVQ